MILLPAGRFLINPFPPGVLAARLLAAAIRVPLVFFILAAPEFVMITPCDPNVTI
jgi:hypothetical protein